MISDGVLTGKGLMNGLHHMSEREGHLFPDGRERFHPGLSDWAMPYSFKRHELQAGNLFEFEYKFIN